MMERRRTQRKTTPEKAEDTGIILEEPLRHQTAASEDNAVELADEMYEEEWGGRRLGGPTGGGWVGGGKGPAVGEVHPPSEDDVLHIGSPEETQAALEEKIAGENTKQLRDW